MTKYSGTDTKFRVKSDEALGEHVGEFLRSMYPRKTADMVAADLGISATTVAAWLSGKSVPGGIAIGKLLKAYGPEFGAAVYGIEWLKQAARDSQVSRLRAERDALDTRLARLGA